MGSSRRSSDTSLEDSQSKASLSLEYDDYPLDLMSPVNNLLDDPALDPFLLDGINLDDPGFISSLLREHDNVEESGFLSRLLGGGGGGGGGGSGGRRRRSEAEFTSSLLKEEVGIATREDAKDLDPEASGTRILNGGWRDGDVGNHVTRRLEESDRFITDEILTDMGRRSLTDYYSRDTGRGPMDGDGDGDGELPVFVTQTPPVKLVYPAAARRHGDYGPLAADETHYEKSADCASCKQCCMAVCRPCLLKYNPLPEPPSWRDRCRHAFLCPPHGRLAHLVALGVGAALAWGVLWTLTGQQALPGGPIFALTVLMTAAYTAGQILEKIKVPPVVGMLVTGCLLRSVPVINVARDIDTNWSGFLRTLALTVVLLRLGLNLDPRAARKLSFTVYRLAFLPSICETVAVAVASHYLLAMPWLWAFLLGFVTSSVAPNMVVPSMLALHLRGYGAEQGVPGLVIAAASVDHLLSTTGFAVILATICSQGGDSMLLAVFRGPLEALAGIMFGAIMGLFIWFFPDRKNSHANVLRFTLLFGAALFAAFGSATFRIPGAGIIGCLATGLVSGIRWRKQSKTGKISVEKYLRRLWSVLEPLLYGLVGAEIDISLIERRTIALGVAVAVVGSVLRLLAAFVSVLGVGFSTKEKIFIPFAWLPKATMQAAFSCVALDIVRQNGADLEEEHLNLALQVTFIAALVVLMMASLGGVLVALTGPCLLSKPDRQVAAADDSEKVDLTWDDRLDFNLEISKLKASDLSNSTAAVEITTERETVT